MKLKNTISEMKILLDAQKSRTDYIPQKKILLNMKREQFKIYTWKTNVGEEADNNDQQSVGPYQAIPEGEDKRGGNRNKVEEV